MKMVIYIFLQLSTTMSNTHENDLFLSRNSITKSWELETVKGEILCIEKFKAKILNYAKKLVRNGLYKNYYEIASRNGSKHLIGQIINGSSTFNLLKKSSKSPKPKPKKPKRKN